LTAADFSVFFWRGCEFVRRPSKRTFYESIESNVGFRNGPASREREAANVGFEHQQTFGIDS
jgi:hypothetical protein